MDAVFRVVGIDPGLTRMGYGLVEMTAGRLTYVDAGTLSTSPGAVPGRLQIVFRGISGLIRHWAPNAMAVERVFLKANLKTAVPAIQAGGIALLAGASAGIEVTEYSPAQVKQAITGVGSASKDQVRFMVQRLLSGNAAPDSPDAADALAVAITHLHSNTAHYESLTPAGKPRVGQ